MKVRIQFEKLGAVRFTSHRDVLRIFERAFAAGGIPIAWSEGFHPHMRMSFGPPLRTGWESREEFMDATLEGSVEDFVERVNAKLPAGLRVTRVVPIDERTPKLAPAINAVRMDVFVAADDAAADAASLSRRVLETFIETQRAENAPRVTEAEVVQTEDAIRIRYTSTMDNGRVVTPEAVVSAVIGDPESFRVPIKVVRLAQFVTRGDRFLSPLDEGVVQANI